ncbi:helix-turn-helix domain-containing protein [Microbacterium karelineae]|uniref:helix-turn-helix domain-containing protein n=1 Tax=Microbacterium karelineae TaxID=2654283 RepID=UPI0012EA5BEB|nr:XRE family transcriptional regulator [Microbacterium karelineae]
MDDASHQLAQAIGSRVRAARQSRGWTLDQLAEASGVSRRMIVNVEKGEASPGIAILLSLSDALGIGLPALVEPPHAALAKVTRSGDGAVLWRGDHGGEGVLVAGTQPPDVVELWDWTLAPGERHDSEPHAAGTKELLQVQSGSMRVEVAGEGHALAAGDALAFDGDAPHAYASDAGARFILTVFEPGVGA